ITPQILLHKATAQALHLKPFSFFSLRTKNLLRKLVARWPVKNAMCLWAVVCIFPGLFPIISFIFSAKILINEDSKRRQGHPIKKAQPAARLHFYSDA